MTNIPRFLFYCFGCAMIAMSSGCAGGGNFSGQKTIKVLTYNVHHGVGTDSVFDIDRIAGVIRQSDADIVALQDIDRWMKRTGKMDIMTKLADLTSMTYTFAECMDLDGGEHGNGLLTRFPILEEKPLLFRMQKSNDQRGLMRLVLDVHGTQTLFMNSELNGGGNDSLQKSNLAEIAAAAKEYVNVPIILCLSFSSADSSADFDAITTSFRDCRTLSGLNVGAASSTFPREVRTDFVFLSKPQIPQDSKTEEIVLRPVELRFLESTASDHRPLLVTLSIGSH